MQSLQGVALEIFRHHMNHQPGEPSSDMDELTLEFPFGELLVQIKQTEGFLGLGIFFNKVENVLCLLDAQPQPCRFP